MWDIRRASLADRYALIDLCNEAMGADDYPIAMMEDMILHGVWYVALDGARIVGGMHYSDTIDGSGWLAAARTHPAFRRRGVASALGESFVGLARRTRVPALRLWSSATNEEGTAAARAMGFAEVARFTRVKRGAAKSSQRSVPVSFDEDEWLDVEASPLARTSGGYVPYEWYFLPLTRANVHLLCNKKALYRVADGLVCLSLHPEEDPGQVLSFGLVTGDPEGVLSAMPSVAHGLGFDELVSFIPNDPRILACAEATGFRRGSWGQEAILFEKRIDLGPASYRRRPTYAEIAAGKRAGSNPMAHPEGHTSHGPSGLNEDRWNL